MPSDYYDLIWEKFWYDVVFKIKLKTGEVTTNHLQMYNIMAEILAAAFGEKKKEKPIKVNELNENQAVNSLNEFFAMAGR